jgi:hypothetical protein
VARFTLDTDAFCPICPQGGNALYIR